MSIPSETDILLTHGPPAGILDNTPKFVGARPTGDRLVRSHHLNPQMPSCDTSDVHSSRHTYSGDVVTQLT